ncbi:hypothetical protein DFJ73DRAFT_136618 [Zopfochytrium polystomum]|nr:hypothetical protein DFJ73DRAFT_136618 [Zopfochytrium polystomum]
MTSQTTAWIVAFVYNGLGRKIHIPTNTGFDGLLQLVAARFQISPAIELVYVDSATSDAMVLDTSDDLPSLLSQNYTWKVLAVSSGATGNVDPAGTSNPSVVAPPAAPAAHGAPAAPAAPAATAAPTIAFGGHSTVAATVGDSYDKSLPLKKDKWIELIPDDWECKSSVQNHPFFISYRQASEAGFARNLFDRMKITLLEAYTGSVLTEESRMAGRHAFWDAECLAYAQDWGINFMSGLFHSSVIILLCSDVSMVRMQKADKEPDNCLLEWELALQMKKERGHDILPVLLSCRDEATLANGKKAKVMVDFSTFDLKKFPDHPHAHPLSPGLQSVSQTIKMILDLNGPKANPENDVMKIVTEAREVYSRRKAELKTPSPSQDISLSRSSLAELANWLSPLSEFMDLEREALLKNVLSGSRVWLLERVFKFLSPDDPSAASANRVMWLKGVAGVGKSVMAAMVSRELQAQGI